MMILIIALMLMLLSRAHGAFAPHSEHRVVSLATRNARRSTPSLLTRYHRDEQNLIDDPACPVRTFTMNYIRFRVPVSSAKDKTDYSPKKGLFSGIQMAMDKAIVDRKYSSKKNESQRNQSFHWIEPTIDVSKDDDRIAKGKMGIFTSSVVWEKTASVVQDCLKAPGDTYKTIVSIPRASVASLLQVADIINWYNDQNLGGMVNINAEVDQMMPVPTIVLEACSSSSSSNTNADTIPPLGGSTNHLSDEQIIQGTQSWVKRVLVQLGICPFTKSVTKSGQGLGDVGVPVGRIAYHCSHAKINEIPSLMADTWKAILEMIEKGPSGKEGISSILLSAPEYDHDFPLWAGPIFAMLEANVSAASAEPLIGIVCFHPQYKTPNGKSWPGFGQMHSLPRLRKWLQEENEELSSSFKDEDVAAGGAYQRRTPFATINVLRAEQLEAAEGRRSTSSLYAKNIQVLHEYGYSRLQQEIDQERI